jgi:hypothetical protein
MPSTGVTGTVSPFVRDLQSLGVIRAATAEQVAQVSSGEFSGFLEKRTLLGFEVTLVCSG